MFNSPIVDIALGLIFIFLIYSMLATSIQEAIATGLGMRAKMLKKSIVDNMLSDTPDWSPFKSLGISIGNTVKGCLSVFRKAGPKTSLGEKFYDHPIIKNYGESRLYPLPSYIPRHNFSAVLLDILRSDFVKNVPEIAALKQKNGAAGEAAQIEQDLRALEPAQQIKELLEYHLHCYDQIKAHNYFLQCDICRILEMHLRNSAYNLDAFTQKLEGWFDDSMQRVSGWYKRKTQFILFSLGLIIAVVFNVNVISITKKLSTDKDARAKMVEMAIAASDNLKENRLVTKDSITKPAIEAEDAKVLVDSINKQITEVKASLNGDIAKAGEVLALGWGKSSGVEFTARNILAGLPGFLILAFGICLGAPFWFDLLNKAIRLRGSGKKETIAAEAAPASPPAQTPPITVVVNTQKEDPEAGPN